MCMVSGNNKRKREIYKGVLGTRKSKCRFRAVYEAIYKFGFASRNAHYRGTFSY